MDFLSSDVKGELLDKNKLAPAVWYKLQELVFVIIFGEPDLEIEIYFVLYTNKIEIELHNL